jgi:hypothetical protein
MTECTRQLSRRSFLFAVGAGGVATAAVVAGKNIPEAQSAPADGDKRATRGYHASQHVDAYYRSAKI